LPITTMVGLLTRYPSHLASSQLKQLSRRRITQSVGATGVTTA
jgi:hypothetical protein